MADDTGRLVPIGMELAITVPPGPDPVVDAEILETMLAVATPVMARLRAEISAALEDAGIELAWFVPVVVERNED